MRTRVYGHFLYRIDANREEHRHQLRDITDGFNPRGNADWHRRAIARLNRLETYLRARMTRRPA